MPEENHSLLQSINNITKAPGRKNFGAYFFVHKLQRWDDREFEIGEELPKSSRWDNGVDTGEELDGTCAIYVSDESDFLDYLDGIEEADFGELDKYNKWVEKDCYDGSRLYLVEIESSWGWEWGEDEGEIVMNGAEVVRRIR